MAFYPPIVHMTKPLCFQFEDFELVSECPQHSHTWGQFNTIDQGVAEIEIEDRLLIAPSSYGIWIPAEVVHSSHYKKAQQYCSIYIQPELTAAMPSVPCILAVEPLTRSIINQFVLWNKNHLDSPREIRLANVLLDQLSCASSMSEYLPTCDDKLLLPILQALKSNPGDKRTLKQWADSVFTTERTLSRRCRKLLGMSFNEWKQRLLFVSALQLLKNSLTVQEIAFELGYSSSSAFIAMFRKHAGTSPEQYIRRWGM
ncbi:helix-turn-helix transcriptional regulator [Vibrio sp. S4M6]|uniref:AraC family transcriptional regulator n=1 Tax=Vibrio sinus TaxID=2946865 RepID=UPI00202AB5EF|nr:helix-turn-helix transcriptional regulator [Vibrio sinus]MCL9782080.1 helix-turn-helix transcriptional regulator [Vibrio sinus]